MVFNYLFLIESADFSFAESDGKAMYEFAIPFTQYTLDAKSELFRQLSNTRHRFCFTLTEEAVENTKISMEELVRFIVTFLFLPGYTRHKGKYILPIAGNPESERLHALKEMLLEELNKQVTHGIIIDFLNCDFRQSAVQENQICFINNELNTYLDSENKGMDFGMLLKKILLFPFLNKKWAVPVNSADDFQQKLRSIAHFENWLSATQPLLSDLIVKYGERDMAYTKLTLDNEILKTKLQNSNDNIKVLRDNALWYIHEHSRLTTEFQNMRQGTDGIVNPDLQRSYDELSGRLQSLQSNRDTILDWYKNEYEVLPTWYKRFGHIIKVITGKRTFKSLFR